jgi:hypothetical protein
MTLTEVDIEGLTVFQCQMEAGGYAANNPIP